jgi:hypothetical protein
MRKGATANLRIAVLEQARKCTALMENVYALNPYRHRRS